METEKRRRANNFATIKGGKFKVLFGVAYGVDPADTRVSAGVYTVGYFGGTVFVFLKLPPAACTIPGYEINLRQFVTVTAVTSIWKHA
jgi:hypothetical protein